MLDDKAPIDLRQFLDDVERSNQHLLAKVTNMALFSPRPVAPIDVYLVPQEQAAAVYAESQQQDNTAHNVIITDTATNATNIQNCIQCVMHSGRTQVVTGQGAQHPKVVFISDFPNTEEDQKNQPFAGPAGAMLKKMALAMKLRADEIYLTKLIKCKPPANIPPRRDHAQTCETHFQAELKKLRPRCIVAMGTLTAQTLLRSQSSLEQLRGNFTLYEDIPLMVTYDPWTLRNRPNLKKVTWTDLQAVMKKLEV